MTIADLDRATAEAHSDLGNPLGWQPVRQGQLMELCRLLGPAPGTGPTVFYRARRA